MPGPNGRDVDIDAVLGACGPAAQKHRAQIDLIDAKWDDLPAKR